MGERRYSFDTSAATTVQIGRGLLPELVRALAVRRPEAVFVIADRAVEGIARGIGEALGARATWCIEGGESAKSLANFGALAERLSRAGATRRALLVAVGGGTLADLIGFLAASYQRGVALWLCPTTSLAQCDAALGGKNGLDHGGLKNLIGTIRQPEAVFCDIDWLLSLPSDARRGGLAELAKMAAVLDLDCWSWLEAEAPRLAGGDPEAWVRAVERAVELKLSVVVADPLEADRRRWLNFGHTLGHALESASDFALTHGDAVALGMLAECRAIESPATPRIAALLERMGLPTRPAERPDLDRLWGFAQQDKKVEAGRVPVIVPLSLGSGELLQLERQQLERAFPA